MKQIIKAKDAALMRLLTFTAALLIAMPLNSIAAEKSATQDLQKVTVAYSSISGNNAPLWVTLDRGFFRKYGLEVQAVLIESGSTAAQSLLSGDVAFAHMAGAAVIQSNLRGSDAVMIAGVINTLTFQLYTDKNTLRPDQLKGKSVGVTRFGSSSDFAMRYALEKYGFEPSKDVAILQLGNMPALLSALETGKIQGAMLSVPTTLKAKKMGFPVLADLQMLGLEYQHTGIATTKSLIKSKPELVRDFMRAYVEGIHYAKTHRKETLDILAKYLRTDDKEILDDTYESTLLALVPEKPYPTLKGIQIMLREIGVKDATARSARPEQFVDLTFIKELDGSGFVDRLYKPAAVVKALPPAEPALPLAGGIVKVPAVEAKAKAVATMEKAQPVAKPLPAVGEKTQRPQIPSRIAKTSAQSQEYTVKPGDTLSKLAERFYNSMAKWEKIFEANREVVKNPNYIYIGMKLMIPMDERG